MDKGPGLSAAEALGLLRAGNERFLSGQSTIDTRLSDASRTQMANEQHPFAIILGCSDSRVPAELVFDQGLGELFVIRVAGNVVAPSQIGSVEFAAATFGISLVVVLGHTRCGAVLATLQELQQPEDTQSMNLKSIVDRIRPSLEKLLAENPDYDPQKLLHDAVRGNVRHAVAQLRHGSGILEELSERGKLSVVGAEYSLETGKVEFFED